jgi:hypothetical protein
MPTRKLKRGVITALLLFASLAARPGTVDAQSTGESCRGPITGIDETTGLPIYGPPTVGCGTPTTPGRPVSGVNTSRGRGPVCTYRPATNGEVIAIANQDVDPGADVTAPAIPTDINGRAHQLTIRTCNGTGTLIVVDLTITITAEAGPVWATATATALPTTITFNPGESTR